jgi:hypothetical protein
MVAYPHPQPPPFVYPFGVAARLAAAGEALVDALAAVERGTGTAFATASEGFEGQARGEVERGCSSTIQRCAALRHQVTAQLSEIEHARQRAQAAEARRDDEIRDWHRRAAAWHEQAGAG